MSDLRDTFFEECDDLLEALSSGLCDLEGGSDDTEIINAMFRAVHSIKGGAGAFGLDRLIEFTHAFESVLDDLRSGRKSIDPGVVALLFTAADHLSDLVDAARDGVFVPDAHGASVLSDLRLMSPDETAQAAAGEATEFVPMQLDFGEGIPDLPDLDVTADPPVFEIRFSAHEALYDRGHDPVLLLRALRDIGGVDVRVDQSRVVPLAECHDVPAALSWIVILAPDDGVDEESVREVFEFVDDVCGLEITLRDGPVEDLITMPMAGDATVAPALAPDPQADVEDAQSPPAPMPATSDTATSDTKGASRSEIARNSTIRVDLERVDRLINLVGELVISEAMLRQSMSEIPRSGNNAVDEAMGQLRQLSGVLQESVMAIRAQPVRSLFQRMSRVAREASREAGKSVRLVLVGEATEVDKTVNERLVEPLTHMIRNAVDHGIETPDQREACGKPAQGVVRLEAAHRSGRVVITLSDDGGGLNRRRIREIAETKGLVRPDEDLSDSDIDNLLFRPGFSTASEVSSLSGRGVGMDVVRNEIHALGGRITLSSEEGAGTTLAISLPLTLAVMEGMVIEVAGETLVVPTAALRETLQAGQASIHAFCDNDHVVSVNGALIPFVDLGIALGFRSIVPTHEDLVLLLIEDDAGRRTALAVDRIEDQREVVIKGLEENYHTIPGVAAATILGDGKIALIVDTDEIPTSAPVLPGARRGDNPPAMEVTAHA